MRIFIHLFLALFVFLNASGSEASPTIIRDSEIESNLKDWTKGIFKVAGMEPSQIDIIIVQSPEVNAFVAGGSNIFIYTGLIEKTKTPEELIGVIAHETGHIEGGHLIRTRKAMENASFETMLTTILGLGAAIAGGGGEAGAAGIQIGRAAGLNSFLTHSRVQESAADQAGMRYMIEAGIHPQGLIDFLKTLSSQELLPASSQSAYMRSHPITRDRIEALENFVQTSKFQTKDIPAKWREEHARMKAKLAGFITPSSVSSLYKSNDTSIAARYARAIAAYRTSRTNDALTQIDSLIQSEPRNPYFHELKGQVLYETGKADQSLAPFQTALSLDSSSGLIRTAYAQSLIDTNNFDKAILELNRAERDEPRSTRIKRLLATATGRLGNESDARVYLAEEALLQNRLPEAQSMAEQALKTLSPSSPLRIRAQDVISLSQSVKDRKNQ